VVGQRYCYPRSGTGKMSSPDSPNESDSPFAKAVITADLFRKTERTGVLFPVLPPRVILRRFVRPRQGRSLVISEFRCRGGNGGDSRWREFHRLSPHRSGSPCPRIPGHHRTDHGNRLSPPERTHPAPGVEQPYFLPSHEISDPAVAIRSALVARISERISSFGQGGTEVFMEVRCSA
jgi:hypothetical protein